MQIIAFAKRDESILSQIILTFSGDPKLLSVIGCHLIIHLISVGETEENKRRIEAEAGAAYSGSFEFANCDTCTYGNI